MSLGRQDILGRFYFSIQKNIDVCLSGTVELVWDQARGSCWNWHLGQNLYSYIVLLLES